MKTKKNVVKPKKKKSHSDSDKTSAIRKAKKPKNVKNIQNNAAILETLKKDVNEQDGTKKQILNRQLVWNTYLKTFSEVEKLNKKQKQIMEFCTNKSLTPPKRKRKFLNFIRNCFINQADVTDEQINELFDMLLKKYDNFKSGSYCVTNNKNDANSDAETTPKVSVNKKKKLKRAAAKASSQSGTADSLEGDEEKTGKIKRKKKKRVKSNDEMQVDDQSD